MNTLTNEQALKALAKMEKSLQTQLIKEGNEIGSQYDDLREQMEL